MSNGSSQQLVPLDLSVAPFPEGFQGDLDETFQQAVQLMSGYLAGNFLTGLVLPPGSTLPTSDQGPIAMGGVWYFFDPTTGQYLPQSTSVKAARNYAKNCVYQIQQYQLSGAVPSGVSNVCDLTQVRSTLGNVLAISAVTGPPADANGDYRPSALQYTVGPTLVPTPGSTDLYAHEHLIEGCDIAMIQGEILTLSVDVWFNQPGTYSVYLTSSGRDVSYVSNFTIATANTWARIKLGNIPPMPTTIGTWHFGEGQTGLYVGVAMCVGSQWQATAGALNSWQHAFFAGSTANSNLCTVVNNQMRVTGIKLEASPTATYLSVPSFETDFHDATRYYWTNFTYQSLTAGMPMTFVASATNAAYGSLMFPRRMCRVPNVVPYSSNSHAAGNVYDVNSAADIAVATLSATQKGTGGAVTITAGTKGDILTAHVIADARLS